TPSLGVPVRFAEVATMDVICEFASKEEGFMPELSYGSHFFQDLVESGIFYVAVFDGHRDVVFNPERVLREPNVLAEVSATSADLADVIHVVAAPGLTVYSNVITQEVRCG
ncbi:MAG: PEP/pyruvate-binding domain-containing protein, partial [Actinomycetota bacterium]